MCLPCRIDPIFFNSGALGPATLRGPSVGGPAPPLLSSRQEYPAGGPLLLLHYYYGQNLARAWPRGEEGAEDSRVNASLSFTTPHKLPSIATMGSGKLCKEEG